jgi:hypothetical protein
MSNSNQPLVSGSGNGNPAISTAWKYAIINAVMNFAAGLFLMFILRDTKFNALGLISGKSTVTHHFGTASYVMLVLGIGLAISALYVGSIVAARIAKTEIDIYEDKVRGTAVDKVFSIANLIFMYMGWNKAKLIGFDLAINQITSVDLDGHSMIINASGTSYKCFVSNGSEIQTFINNKIRNG